MTDSVDTQPTVPQQVQSTACVACAANDAQGPLGGATTLRTPVESQHFPASESMFQPSCPVFSEVTESLELAGHW